MVLKKIIRPALIRAGVHGKVIGWHSFRHSLATNLRAAGVELKTAQGLLRHANSRMTLEIYTRGVSETKREANDLVVQLMLEGGNRRLSGPRALRWKDALTHKIKDLRVLFELQHPQTVFGIATMRLNR